MMTAPRNAKCITDNHADNGNTPPAASMGYDGMEHGNEMLHERGREERDMRLVEQQIQYNLGGREGTAMQLNFPLDKEGGAVTADTRVTTRTK